MDILIAFAIIAFAGLMHASFQLSISVLTLLSGHSFSKQHSRQRTLSLTSSFVLGALISTSLILASGTLIILQIASAQNINLLWSISAGLLIGVGLAVWIGYYRNKQEGTELWIPRQMANFLHKRSRQTKHSAEAFSLGVTSVLAEIIFIVAPILAACLALISLPANLVLVGIIVYVLISGGSLLVVWAMVISGSKLSQIQQWRATNKFFLQSIAAVGLTMLGAFIFINQILASGL